jgi:preprotein translocase subunit Sec61beta
MLNQIIGACCFVTGLLILIGFPYILRYQPEAMGRAGIFIGILLIIIGIILMKV